MREVWSRVHPALRRLHAQTPPPRAATGCRLRNTGAVQAVVSDGSPIDLVYQWVRLMAALQDSFRKANVANGAGEYSGGPWRAMAL